VINQQKNLRKYCEELVEISNRMIRIEEGHLSLSFFVMCSIISGFLKIKPTLLEKEFNSSIIKLEKDLKDNSAYCLVFNGNIDEIPLLIMKNKGWQQEIMVLRLKYGI